jgi:hypothetical protein
MFVRVLAIGGFAFALGNPSLALADQTAASVAGTQALSPQAQAEAVDAKKIVCRSVPVTGSRFPTRQCASKTAWAAQEEAARKAGHETFDRVQVETRRD